jgi:hypothetical protein
MLLHFAWRATTSDGQQRALLCPRTTGPRMVAGLAVLSVLFVYPASEWRYLGLLAVVLLSMGLSGDCPLNGAPGPSTCPSGLG